METSIIGFSSASALTSLLLAEKREEHHFHMLGKSTDFLDYPPISNPLINFNTQNLEKKYLNVDWSGLQYVSGYDFQWYTTGGENNMRLKGKYKFPICAIDNRIRYSSYWDGLNSNPLINIVKHDTKEELKQSIQSDINILGDASVFSSLFEDNPKLPQHEFALKRSLFYFNLEADAKTLSKYSDTISLFIESLGYLFLYPSFHKTNKNVLTIVVNLIDYKKQALDSYQDRWLDTLAIIEKYSEGIYKDIRHCEVINENYFVIEMLPYFKKAVKTIDNQLIIGIGDVVFKNDPITAQGLNGTSLVIAKLVNLMAESKDVGYITREIAKMTEKISTQQYHINLAFAYNKYLNCVSPVFGNASNNERLKDFIIAETTEDPSLYFPWLTDELESKKLISNFSGSFLSYRFKNLLGLIK